MPVIADLHIHSRFSRATSARLNPAGLDRWARIKGIGLVGTGDCTHPQWLAELRDNLADAEPGLFTLNDSARAVFDRGPALTEELPLPGAADAPRFVLSGEISTIYKSGGKTRKIHHLVLLPGFQAAAAFQTKLERAGNIRSDGRPILGVDSRVLLSLLLEADDRSLLIPAHIWTPWFSALGAKSGFDSIEECYGGLASYIPAVETGLSSDPPMNWALSSLDRFSIISNSDAHSPDKLGREATVFDMDYSWPALCGALRGGVLATIEFFPEEGKYHYDGHRKCGVCIGPDGTVMTHNTAAVAAGTPVVMENGDIRCPVCGKPLTRGVMGRVLELADRPIAGASPAPGSEGNRRPFHSLIPLREILGELLGTGPASKKVDAAYSALIETCGSELAILMDRSPGDLAKTKAPGLSGGLLAEAIGRMRRGEVSISPGYDGEYGVVTVFPPGEQPEHAGGSLFAAEPAAHNGGGRAATPDAGNLRSRSPRPHAQKAEASRGSITVDAAQEAIINSGAGRAVIIAGPGTGKTAVLAARIARLIDDGAAADSILALTFTVKAAAELRERIGRRAGVVSATFHSFCCSTLREQAAEAGIPADFAIIDEARREELLRELRGQAEGKAPTVQQLGNYIEERKRFLLLPGEREPAAAAAIIASLGDMLPVPEPVPVLETLYARYRNRLREAGLLDYEDLIAGTARLLCAKSGVRAEYRRRFRHIFVDEYQDINLSQYILLQLLAGDPALGETEGGGGAPSLWVIGDPNQAIYGFRGSDKRFIDRLSREDQPGGIRREGSPFTRFALTRSFRCAAPIINAAGRLAGVGLRGTDKPVDLYRREYATDKSEAEGVARAISRLIGGASFFAKDSDDGGDTRHEYSDYADTAAPGDCAVLIRAAPLAAPIAKALTDHGIPFELAGERPWWEAEPFAAFLDRVRRSAAPETEFQTGRENPALKRLFDLAAFFGSAVELLDALSCNGPDALPEWSREGVRIMTIHASKGLEFDHVFIIGLEDGLLPFTLFDGGEAADRIAEERRLLYVAMTRARVGLRLSWARSRHFKGRTLNGSPSPFLAELEHIVPLAEGKRPPKKDGQLTLFQV